MYIPNADLYTILSTFKSGVTALTERPETIEIVPSVTYRVEDNGIEIDLGKEIAYQNIIVIVDIWASNKKDASEILSALEEDMRDNNYVLNFSSEVSDPRLAHITTRFNLVI